MCGDVLTKKKLDPHRNRCWGATFSCIDCMVHFPGTEYRAHTSCMTEEQKYQGALYKPKKTKGAQNTSNPTPAPAMAQPAYVEDATDEAWRHYQEPTYDNDSPVDPLPEAPTPPSAAEPGVNVFDFLVAPTPTASHVNLPATNPIQHNEETQLVRFDANAAAENLAEVNDQAMVEYGGGPVPSKFETPMPKERKKKDGERTSKSDKKRKRLHIETDQVMTDAPPVHSGLTGGINRMMRPVFPPSPDFSSNDDAAKTPASPLKKSKSKHHKSRPEANSLISILAGATKTKKKKKSTSSSSTKKKSSSSSSKLKQLDAPKEPKLLEYKTDSKDDKENSNHAGQMIVYRPRAEHFLGLVNKGPESERGCSINKALKRYHRERSASGTSLSKVMEEKELWRSLRMRKNERGEIVLFCI